MQKLPVKYYNRILKINESLDHLVQEMQDDGLDACDNIWILQAFERLENARNEMNESEISAVMA